MKIPVIALGLCLAAAPAWAKFPATAPTTPAECRQDKAIWLRVNKGATPRDYEQQAIPTTCQLMRMHGRKA